MSATAIYQALLGAILAVPGIPPVNRPGTVNVTPVNAPYIDLTHMPNTPGVFTLGDDGEDRHDGITQLTLCYPPDSGLVALLKLGDTLRAAFKAGRPVLYDGQEVKIINSGVSATPVVIDGRLKLPFTISWYAFTRR